MYASVGLILLEANDPDYKNIAGTALYYYVARLVGPLAPKITGMLIDLPIDDLKLVLRSYELLKTRVG